MLKHSFRKNFNLKLVPFKYFINFEAYLSLLIYFLKFVGKFFFTMILRTKRDFIILVFFLLIILIHPVW